MLARQRIIAPPVQAQPTTSTRRSWCCDLFVRCRAACVSVAVSWDGEIIKPLDREHLHSTRRTVCRGCGDYSNVRTVLAR